MPAPQRHITKNKESCNCDICKAAVAQAKYIAETPVGPRRRLPHEQSEDECSPCARRRIDIILRNKRAVKILSKKIKIQRAMTESPSCGVESTKLLPTLKKARWPTAYNAARGSPRWPEAYAAAREPCTSDTPKNKCKKPTTRKKASIVDMLTTRRDCACELMANAIRADLHRHLALSERRENINAGVINTPPPEPAPLEKDLETKK